MLPGIPDDPRADDDPARTMIVRYDDAPTALVPQVPPVAPPGPLRALLPWVAFALVAVAVVAATVTWASTLRGAQAPAAAALGEPALVTAPPAVPPAAPPAVVAPATTEPGPAAAPVPRTLPAPTARRAVPAPARPVAPEPGQALAPAPAVTTTATTTGAAATTTAGRPSSVFGPGYTAGCSDPVAAAADPSCDDDLPGAADAPPAP